MLQPKLRRAVASVALLSALSLLPAHAAAPRAPRAQRSQAPVAAAPAGTVWELFTRLLNKFGSVINPDGRDTRQSLDSAGRWVGDLDGSH